MPSDLPKAYVARDYEEKMYELWEKSGCFSPETLPARHQNGEAYTIVMPPPNRTGVPHAGHAMGMTIQDALIRFWRLRGRKTLLLPGTDHAAIATQIKVEKLLREQGSKDPKNELGREKFLLEVEKFSANSADAIRKLVRGMGVSCDWSRERFTMDEGCNHAVNEMFVRMYEDGLIERGFRVVNWDTQFQTTLSDDEVLTKETTAKLYTFRYAKDFPMLISTTRPETKFGDTAVAVHPSDERYAAFVGKTFETSFCGKLLTIRVIADEAVDPAFGTGALGVTPAHSMIDAQMATTHGLPTEIVIGKDGRLLANCGEFGGLTIEEARMKIAARLAEEGLLETTEEVAQNLPISEKGGGPVEQLPMEQWFVRVNKSFALRQDTLNTWKKGDKTTLKELMLEAVHSGKTRLVPESFTRVYDHWINHLQDWCISRQIWYGHRIPAWHKDGEIQVGVASPGEDWTQDPDTLDTWFSSGMWTFSTLGWPDATPDLKTFHPTNVLETGRDLIFFWITRMILMSTYALGDVPFRDVYFHGMVLDGDGRKMSKSIGNIVDPFEFIPVFGTDAVRLSLVVGGTPGQDMKLSPIKIETARNFTNKLWNLSRFILAKEVHLSGAMPTPRTLADRWILARTAEVIRSTTDLFEKYQLSMAGEMLREFVWNDLADWYVEIAKMEPEGKDAMLGYLLKTTLTLLHPLMPFVTEAIWQEAGFGGTLALADWPMVSGEVDQKALHAFASLRALVVDGRRVRAEAKVDAAKKLVFEVMTDASTNTLIEQNAHWLKRLLGASSLVVVDAISLGAVATASGTSMIAFIPEAPSEDDGARLAEDLAEAERYLADVEARLANQEFIAKAPERVVNDLKQKHVDARERVGKLRGRI